jgi:hypothetical protein
MAPKKKQKKNKKKNTKKSNKLPCKNQQNDPQGYLKATASSDKNNTIHDRDHIVCSTACTAQITYMNGWDQQRSNEMRWEHFENPQEQLTGSLNNPDSGPGHTPFDNGLNKKLVMAVPLDQLLVRKLHFYMRLADFGDKGHGSNQLNPPLAVPVLCSPCCHG